MANPSNLYAEKIFAEHPSVLWALDDAANFISYIPSTVQDLTTWTFTGTDSVATFNNSTSPYPKIKTSSTTLISGTNNPSGSIGDPKVISAISATTFSSPTEDFIISCWFYSYNSKITSIELGYQKSGGTAVTQSQTISRYGEWIFVSKRFTGIRSDTNTILKINYVKSGDAGEAYDFLVNGFSIGYQSEEFGSEYTGLTKQSFPTTLSWNNFTCAWSGVSGQSMSTKTFTDGSSQINYIRNPNIEINSTGWGTRNGTNSRSTTTSYSGSASILYTVGSSGTAGGVNMATTRTAAITAVTPSSPSSGYVKYTSNNVFVAGDVVTTTNLAPSGYNGTFTITEATSTYFIVANSTTATVTDAIGTATINNLIPIIPGQTYTYYVYIKDVDTAKAYNGIIDYYNSSAAIITGSSSIGPETSVNSLDWTRVSYTFTVPATVGTTPTVPAYVRPYTYTVYPLAVEDSGKTAYYDAFTFIKSSSPQPYFDGNTVDSVGGIEALAYGGKDLSGYYVVDNNILYAKNTSIPMVYGASNITKLTPHPLEKPSLIVPGLGFLNESGKNIEKTFEAWLRINSHATEPTRIFGPINSTDGLYVNGPFLILKIDDNIISHSMSEWFRPIIIQIAMTRNFVSLTINGELVGSMVIDTDNLASVNANTKYDANDKDQDWLGFYATTDIPSIEIDCLAIYPYLVNDTLAKRRFVYGQGVKFPENLDIVYNGKSAIIDYSFADYSNNYNYPQIGKWKQGISDNFLVTDKYLSVPDYETPTIKLSSGTEESWLSNLNTAQLSSDPLGSFIRIRPSSPTWDSVNGYLLFDNINILNEHIYSIYGIFKRDGSSASEQTLIKLENKLNGDYFKISINGTNLYYKSYISGTTTTLLTVSSIGTTFVAGIDIDTLISTASVDLTSIFRNLNYVKMYIGGDSLTSSTTFDGNIYHVGLCSERNFNKIEALFDSNGYIDTTQTITHIPSYGVFLNTDLNIPSLDILSNSYWEDYVPLSVFGKYVSNSSGTKEYDIDFIQFNIDYPRPKLYGPFNSYYDTTDSIVKTYVTFKYLDEGAMTDPSFYTSTIEPKTDMTVGPFGEFTTWDTIKWGIVDGSVIYPPTTFTEDRSFENVAIVVHVESFVNGIKRNPLKIKSVELASKSLDDNITGTYTAINPIGTKLGTKIYSFYGDDNYKEPSPHTIYKGTSPHLYRTSNSGLKTTIGYVEDSQSGLMLKINEQSLPTYNMSSMQIALMKNEEYLVAFEDVNPIFEIKDRSGTISFYVASINSDYTRARIYAKQNNSPYTKLKYYWNGKLVNEPILNVNEWGMLGIVFTELLDFNSSPGHFKIWYPILFDLLSFYQIDEKLQKLQLLERTWLEVKNPSPSDSTLYPLLEETNSYLQWDWNNSSAITWKTIAYKTARSEAFADPNNIYKTYIGNNKIIVNSNNSSGKLSSHAYNYSIYQNGLVETTFTPEVA
jgi:hypothetical protein